MHTRSKADDPIAFIAPGDRSSHTQVSTYVLVLLTSVSFFNYLDRMVIAILLEPIKQELNLSDSQMGMIAGFAFAMLYAVMGLPLARVADRKSRVALISICLAVWSAMTAITGLVRNFTELFMARMAVGVGEAGCVPAAHSLLGDLFPVERRAFAVSVFQAGGVLGQSAGLAMAGLAAQMWGWRAALVLTGLLGIPLAVLMFVTVREPRRVQDSTRVSEESIIGSVRALIVRAPLVNVIFGISIAAFGSYGMLQWLPAFFIRSHGLSISEVGLYTGLTGALGGVVGTVFGGYALTRLGPRDERWELWWPMIVFTLFPLLMIPSLIVEDWRLSLIILLVAYFVGSSGGGVALSAVQTYVEPHRRATAIAITLLMSSLIGLGLGPVVVGVISDYLSEEFGSESLRYALIASTFMPFWSAAHFYLAARASRPWRENQRINSQSSGHNDVTATHK